MKKIYCNQCEKNVISEHGRCSNCGLDLKNEASTRDFFNHQELNETNDIVVTYQFFSKYANAAKMFCFVIALLMAFLSITLLYETDGLSLILLLISILIVFYGILLEKHLKWKSYMLQTNYEIQKKQLK